MRCPYSISNHVMESHICIAEVVRHDYDYVWLRGVRNWRISLGTCAMSAKPKQKQSTNRFFFIMNLLSLFMWERLQA